MRGMMITIDSTATIVVESLTDPDILDKAQKAVGGNIELVPYFDTIMIPSVLGLDNRNLPPEIMQSPQPCAVFCNEEGKLEGMPVNSAATLLWRQSLGRSGSAALDDALVGPIVVFIGDPEFMDNL